MSAPTGLGVSAKKEHVENKGKDSMGKDGVTDLERLN